MAHNLLEKIFLAFIILVLISFAGFVLWTLSTSISDRLTLDKDCLTEIAEEICLERNKFFSKLSWSGISFYCVDDRRDGLLGDSFRFLDSELQECRK